MAEADPLSLAGRVAIVTGSGRGIGAAIARLFSRAGAHLALLDKDGATVSRTAEEIGLAGGEALPFTADVTTPSRSSESSTRWPRNGTGSTSW